MEPSVTANALKRKTSRGQREREVQGLTPTRAIRVALARAAGDLWELPLAIASIRSDLVSSERLAAVFEEDAMMVLLDGPDGIRGGMAIGRDLVTSVTEVQTIGAVSERVAPARPYTPTDAALVAPLIDAMLERVDVSLSGSTENGAAFERAEIAWALGYRFGAKVDRARSLLLALEGEAFHVVSLDVDIATGMKKSTMVLCLPEREKPGACHEPETVAQPGEHADALSTVPTRLAATLPRFRLALSKATSLQVGDLLPLSNDALNSVILRAADGRGMARCTLGKVGDLRALRLQGPRGAARPAAPTFEDVYSEDGASGKAGSALTDRFVPHDRITSTRPAPRENVDPLPDLPPLDFDAPDPWDADAPADKASLALK